MEAKDSDDPSTSLDEDAMETPETLAGSRERAPAEGVMGPDIPAQSIDNGRLRDLHLACEMEK